LVVKAMKEKAKGNGQKFDEASAKKEAKELLAKADPNNKFMVKARKNVEESRALAADLDDLV
jgi:23S rRNA pseudoU1915 N3-methylase RlmH